MLFQEGLKTVRYDREGKAVLESHSELKELLKQRCRDFNKKEGLLFFVGAQLRTVQSMVDEIDESCIQAMPNKLVPLCMEEWLEENYNVMA